MCLSCFFQCNGHLREEIFLALRSNRLFDVCPDRCAGADELFGQNKVDQIFRLPANVPDDLHCETETLVLHNALRTSLLLV